MSCCRACSATDLVRVLDLGRQPAADHFPLVGEPVEADDTGHPLAMDLCRTCGLAQLAEDDTVTDEPRGVEPQALVDQAVTAVQNVADAGWLTGRATVREFGSPHGGTWIPLLTGRGAVQTSGAADVVLDSFGIMHEPDQRKAFTERAAATAPDGVLLLQFHSLAAIVTQGQWNALRHGHFAYYSLPVVVDLLARAGMQAVDSWEYDLYGGTVLLAAVHGTDHEVSNSLVAARRREERLGITDPDVVRRLGADAERQVRGLRDWAERESATGARLYAYGAASRAVALFAMAEIDRSRIRAVADASPAKQGRRMPGTDVPIIAPEELVAAEPDAVLLTLPDLLGEVERRYPELRSRWVIDVSSGS